MSGVISLNGRGHLSKFYWWSMEWSTIDETEIWTPDKPTSNSKMQQLVQYFCILSLNYPHFYLKIFNFTLSLWHEDEVAAIFLREKISALSAKIHWKHDLLKSLPYFKTLTHIQGLEIFLNSSLRRIKVSYL